MWRVMTVLPLLMVLACTACSSDSVPVVTEFCARAELVYRDQTLCGSVERSSINGTAVTFSEPFYENTLRVRWNGAELITQLGDETLVLKDSLPLSAPRLLHEVYERIADDKQHGIALSGEVDGCCYRCEYDDSTGLPVSVTFSDIPLIVRFSNVICLSET